MQSQHFYRIAFVIFQRQYHLLLGIDMCLFGFIVACKSHHTHLHLLAGAIDFAIGEHHVVLFLVGIFFFILIALTF